MIETLRIQNFKSIKDATVNLKDVNLLIGPNNSGKSNFFAALEFLKNWFEKGEVPEDLERFYFKKKFPKGDYKPISFTFYQKTKHETFATYSLEIFHNRYLMISEFKGDIFRKQNFNNVNFSFFSKYFKTFYSTFSKDELFDRFLKDELFQGSFEQFLDDDFNEIFNKIEVNHSRNGNYVTDLVSNKKIEKISIYRGEFIINKELSLEDGNHALNNLYNTLLDLKIYSIDINTLKKPFPTLANEMQVSEDASNLVAFLDNMDDQNPEVIRRIEKDLKYCIPEFKGLRFLKVRVSEESNLFKIYGNQTYKKIGLYDTFKQTYWADELSEGTLYFLALLAIIHQPNPPKLLLLEEPEKGIHPRRISEIMDFIFELAELKGIQVIISTHSTQVVDEFKEMPENIFVFDKPNDETMIRNLQTEIIDVDNEKLKEKGIPPIELNGSLGQHWANGILGGVPSETH